MKILAESLHQYLKFTETGDPVKDMNIGVEKLIHSWIIKNNVVKKHDYSLSARKYTINTYNTAVLSNLGIEELPEYINFNYVMGGFHCDHNKLSTLRGCPILVSGSFICSYNNLTNLLLSPTDVNGSYIVSHNKLISLEGLTPRITESLSVSNNYLKNLNGIPKIINGDFYIHKNPIESLRYFPDEVKGDLYYTESNFLNESLIRKRCRVDGTIINKQ